MTYESVDQLQKALTEEVFHYAKDSKKAAGRALGTIVEIITFYVITTLMRSIGYIKLSAIHFYMRGELGNGCLLSSNHFSTAEISV